jgi:ABC-type antimicrobial peptide transport system permease subunit
VNDLIDQSLNQERFIAQISGFFSLFALLLASVGLYGIMSHNVTRRTNEIGIRMALGALPGDVLGMVMREAMTLVAIGVIIGLGAAIATTRYIESFLFGLTATDPVTIAAAILVMLAVAATACFLPARRASSVDPMTALRYE